MSEMSLMASKVRAGTLKRNETSDDDPTRFVPNSKSPICTTTEPGCFGATALIDPSEIRSEIRVRSLGITDSKAWSLVRNYANSEEL